MEMSDSLKSMYKSYGDHVDQVMNWEPGYVWTEQYLARKVRAEISRDGSKVKLAIVDAACNPISDKRILMSSDEWAARPKPGKDKAEVRWALGQFGETVSAPE